MAWNPAGFITLDNTQSDKSVDAEQLRVFTEGVYVPWSHEERICPGKRFSQLGLVAMLAVLFYKHGVEVEPEMGDF